MGLNVLAVIVLAVMFAVGVSVGLNYTTDVAETLRFAGAVFTLHAVIMTWLWCWDRKNM